MAKLIVWREGKLGYMHVDQCDQLAYNRWDRHSGESLRDSHGLEHFIFCCFVMYSTHVNLLLFPVGFNVRNVKIPV